MCQHEFLKPLLVENPGRHFVSSFLMASRPWSTEKSTTPDNFMYRSFYEFPFSNGVWCNGFGNRSGTKQVDALLDIHLYPGDLFYQDSVTVAVEIKGTLRDLLHADLTKYIGYTDYYYLAVPSELIKNASALKIISEKPEIGLMDITNGDIKKVAERQCVSDGRRMRNLHTMMGHYIKPVSLVTGSFACADKSHLKKRRRFYSYGVSKTKIDAKSYSQGNLFNQEHPQRKFSSRIGD